MPFFSQFLSASCHPPRCHQKAYLFCHYLERLLQSASFCPFSKKIPSFGAFAISWIILPCFDLFISEPFSNICSQLRQYGHLISILYLNVLTGFLLQVASMTTQCDSLDLNFDFQWPLQSVPQLCVDHTIFHSLDTCHFCCSLRPKSTYDKSNEKKLRQLFLPKCSYLIFAVARHKVMFKPAQFFLALFAILDMSFVSSLILLRDPFILPSMVSITLFSLRIFIIFLVSVLGLVSSRFILFVWICSIGSCIMTAWQLLTLLLIARGSILHYTMALLRLSLMKIDYMTKSYN